MTLKRARSPASAFSVFYGIESHSASQARSTAISAQLLAISGNCTRLCIALLLMAFSACQSDRAERPKHPPAPIPTEKQMQVVSEPSGARIEVNENYIGDAPLSVSVPCTRYGRFVQKTTIRALPVHAGHSVQSKYFSPGNYDDRYGWGEHGDEIPNRIFFDMTLRRRVPQLNVTVE